MRDLLVKELPRDFFLRLQEELQGAFVRARRVVDEVIGCPEPERLAMIGHHRHWFSEHALRNAAAGTGLAVRAPHTEPKGGRYSLVVTEKFVISRTKIITAGHSPKNPKFRRNLAQANRWLEPSQLDLFESVEPLHGGRIFGLVTVIAPKRGHDQSAPAFLGFGIPKSDFSGWHFLESLDKILAAYSGAESAEVPDRAKPRLKSRRERKADNGDVSE